MIRHMYLVSNEYSIFQLESCCLSENTEQKREEVKWALKVRAHKIANSPTPIDCSAYKATKFLFYYIMCIRINSFEILE